MSDKQVSPGNDIPVSPRSLFGLRTPEVRQFMLDATEHQRKRAQAVESLAGDTFRRILSIEEAGSAIFGGLRSYLPEEEGEGYWDFVEAWPGVYIAVGDASYQQATPIAVPAEPLLQIRVVCSGSMTFPEEDVTLTSGRAWLQLLGGENPLHYIIGEREPLRAIVIDMRIESLPALGVLPAMLPDHILDCLEGAGSQNPFAIIRSPEALVNLGQLIVDSRKRMEYGLRLMYVRGKTLELIAEAFTGGKLVDTQQAGSSRSVGYRPQPPWILEAKAILESDLETPLTVVELARLVGVSATKLKTGFRQYTGNSVHRYLTAVRMRRALELLEQTDLQVADIGRRVGFSHAGNFTLAFKKYYGRGPRQFRTMGGDNVNRNPGLSRVMR